MGAKMEHVNIKNQKRYPETSEKSKNDDFLKNTIFAIAKG